VYAYNLDNVTVNTSFTGNRTFRNTDVNTWVQVNITNVAHLQNGFGYTRVRFTPNGTVIGNNLQIIFDEIRFNFTDMTPPNITIISPINNYNTTSKEIMFNFTVTDKVDTNLSCNVTIDGVVNQSLLNITNGTSYNFTVVNFSFGEHRWNVTCLDDSTNKFISTRTNFTVVGGPSQLRISLLSDNDTVNLSWSPQPYVDRYAVYVINDFNEEFSATPNFTINHANFSDREGANKTTRFYRVSAIKGNVNETTNVTLGKYEFTFLNNSPSQFDWQIFSLPFNTTNFTLTNGSNGGADLRVRPHGCIKSLYSYNATIDQFYRTDYNGTVWRPVAGSENFTFLTPGLGYWAEFNRTCNITFVGEVPRANITIPLETGWNVLGWYSPNASTLPTDYAPPNPITTSPTYSIQAIDRYNPSTDLFEVTIHYMDGSLGWGWWPSYNNDQFTSIEPTQGYYFDSTQQGTWIHEPNTKK
jgi:hypothetical protein